MFEITSSDYYWIDSNGNRWSNVKYTKEEALEFSRTLINCSGCINCSYCDDCRQCEDCHYCYCCKGSAKCKFCRDCKQCSECYHCSDCSHCSYCDMCDNCYCCTEVRAMINCDECADIKSTISGLSRYRWAFNYMVIDTGAGTATILVDEYRNLWYQLEGGSQTDWECFVVAFKQNSDRANRDSDTVKSELEYIKSIGEFFHKTIKERAKENDCKDNSSNGASASDC